MSISAISSSLISDLSQQRQNPFQEIKQDFQQLATALQSGDLAGAQSAYSNIQQVLQANGGSGSATGSNTLQSDFAALGQAVQSGDLSQAQSAFSQLQSDAQAGKQASPEQAAQQDYTELSSDLQSGNLTAAQSDYSNLQQLVQAQSPSTSSTSSNTPTTIQTDFATLGQDLEAAILTQG